MCFLYIFLPMCAHIGVYVRAFACVYTVAVLASPLWTKPCSFPASDPPEWQRIFTSALAHALALLCCLPVFDEVFIVPPHLSPDPRGESLSQVVMKNVRLGEIWPHCQLLAQLRSSFTSHTLSCLLKLNHVLNRRKNKDWWVFERLMYCFLIKSLMNC